MTNDPATDLTIDAMQARIDLRKRQETEALIDSHPFQAQIALDNIKVSMRHQQAVKDLKAKEHAAQIRSVRQVHIDKDLYRLNFYNELYFDPAKTVAHGMNSAQGCRILIERYRTFYARLCDSAMLSSREYEFIMTLCGQQVEIPIGTIESQVVYRTLKIAQMRYESDQYETLRSAVDYYSNIILKHLLAGNYPIPGNISSMLAKIHNILMDEIRNHFDFNIEKFDEFNANAHFKGTGRQLFMEFRRYVAKKIWELRRRARSFEQIEPG
ncbi:MAG: hypothetical protein ACKO0V_01980, partial [bacterium]